MYVEDREGKGQVWKKREAVKEATAMGHVPGAGTHIPPPIHTHSRVFTRTHGTSRGDAQTKRRGSWSCAGRGMGGRGERWERLSLIFLIGP